MNIVGMIATYNEEDIIEEIIDHLIFQGIDLVILDNGSTDDTYKKCKQFLGSGLLRLEKFETSNYCYQWDTILRALYDLALIYSPDWLIRSDADEFLESGIRNITLKESISDADQKGFNLIQFDRFDFFMTNKDDKNAKSIKNKMKYYSYHGDYLYRSWKFYPGIKIGYAGGHYPIFPNNLKYNVYPKKLVMRHYTFRSKEQAEKKMNGRIRGTSLGKTKEGLDAHTKNILQQDFTKTIDYNLLAKFEDSKQWNYDFKYTPYIDSIPPRKEDVFTNDGTLKIKHKNQYELELEVHKLNERLKKMKTMRGLSRLAISAIEKKLGKK